MDKQNAKKCPARKETDNAEYFVNRRKQKKKVLQKGTRTHNIYCVKLFLIETTKDKEKEIEKRTARRKQRENTERQKMKTSGFRKNKKKKETSKTSKRENVEKVFWCENSGEMKKGSVKMSKHKFSMKKSFLKKKTRSKRKHKGIFHLFRIKIIKRKPMSNFFLILFFQKKSVYVKGDFFLRTKTFVFEHVFRENNEYVKKKEKTEKNNQIGENLEKRKKRNKGKTDIEEREQTRLVFKNT